MQESCPNPTASKYWLARHCLHPWRGGYAWEARKASYASRLGTYVHRKLECLVESIPDDTGTGTEWGATPRMRTLASLCTASGSTYLSALGPALAGAHAEAAFRGALDDSGSATYTRVFLGSARAYPPLPGLYGTADLLVQVDSARLTVGDWKTGMSAEPYLGHARWQLRWLGVAAVRASVSPVREVTLDAIYVKKDGGKPWVQREVFQTDSKEWLEVQQDVHKTLVRLEGPEEGPRPGPHCKLCPVRGVCPEALR